MIPEAQQDYDCLVRLTRDLLAAVEGVPDEPLNRELPLPETNTLFQIGNHAPGAAGAWIISRAGGPRGHEAGSPSDPNLKVGASGRPHAPAFRPGYRLHQAKGAFAVRLLPLALQ